MPSWFDRFGQEWATSGLTDDPTNAQADAGWAFIGQAPPTVEQFNSMFQWSDDKDNWLYGQIGNVIASANMLPDPTDLNQLLRAITSKLKIKLTAPYTIWVDSINGNDTNLVPGQGTPFRTIQKAMDWAIETIEPAHQWVYIQLQPGTYEQAILQVASFNGGLLIQGDAANPRSYVIKNTNGYALAAAYASWFGVQGVSVEAVGSDIDYETNGTGLGGLNSGILIYKDVAFGPCSTAHMGAWSSGQVWSWGPINYTIYGPSKYHMLAYSVGIVTSVRTHITIQNNPLFTFFAAASGVGIIQAWYMTYTGTARGPRAYVDSNAIHNLAGVSPDIVYPGDAPSVSYRGGLYT